jgi:hypothetical protein
MLCRVGKTLVRDEMPSTAYCTDLRSIHFHCSGLKNSTRYKYEAQRPTLRFLDWTMIVCVPNESRSGKQHLIARGYDSHVETRM